MDARLASTKGEGGNDLKRFFGACQIMALDDEQVSKLPAPDAECFVQALQRHCSAVELRTTTIRVAA